jgi:hypothetical protein
MQPVCNQVWIQTRNRGRVDQYRARQYSERTTGDRNHEARSDNVGLILVETSYLTDVHIAVRAYDLDFTRCFHLAQNLTSGANILNREFCVFANHDVDKLWIFR